MQIRYSPVALSADMVREQINFVKTHILVDALDHLLPRENTAF